VDFIQHPLVVPHEHQRLAKLGLDRFKVDAQLDGLAQFLFGFGAHSGLEIDLPEQQPGLRAVRILQDGVLELDNAALEVAFVLEVLGALDVLLFSELGGGVTAAKRGGQGQDQERDQLGGASIHQGLNSIQSMLKKGASIVIYGCWPGCGRGALAPISHGRKRHGIGPGAGRLQRNTPEAAARGGGFWTPKIGAASEGASMTSTANSDKA